VTYSGGWNSAADLWSRFLVDSGRYLSIFDAMRDGYGIKGGRALQPPVLRLSDEALGSPAHGEMHVAGGLVGSMPASRAAP
jgi:hypothetical protein